MMSLVKDDNENGADLGLKLRNTQRNSMQKEVHVSGPISFDFHITL